MSKQTINIGASPNDGTGTPLRTSFDYTNQNFTEIYTALGGGVALPGATTQVIFNDGGTNLAGDAGLVYNKTTDALTVAGLVTAGSATITGDLTVDTSTLKVDSTNNRVGIVQATPLFPLDVSGSGITGFPIRLISASGTSIRFDTGRSYTVNRNWIVGCDEIAEGVFAIVPSTAIGGSTFTNPVYKVSYDGIHTFLDGAGGTRMTLDSTGLGIRVVPVAARLQLAYTEVNTIPAAGATTGHNFAFGSNVFGLAGGSLSTGDSYLQCTRWDGTATNYNLLLNPNGGNVGIGVTPNSLWAIGKVLQVGSNSGSFLYGAGGQLIAGVNAYYDTSWKYAENGRANYYSQSSGTHIWVIDSGTQVANTACNFTDAMTLDASGNLLVGRTTLAGAERLHIEGSVTSFVSRISNTSAATPSGLFVRYSAAAPNGVGDFFVRCDDNAATRFELRSNGGLGNYSANNVNLSDARTKTDIKPLTSYWNKIKALELVTFKYKDQTHDDDNIGLISQQVESVAPEFVSNDGFGETPADGVPLKAIYTTDLYHAAIKALQEAMTRIEVLESKLA